MATTKLTEALANHAKRMGATESLVNTISNANRPVYNPSTMSVAGRDFGQVALTNPQQDRANFRAGKFDQMFNYLGSQNTDYETTNKFRDEANQLLNTSDNEEEADSWRRMAEGLQQQSFYDNNMRKQANRQEYDQLDQDAQNYINWLRTSDLTYGYGGMSFQALHGMSQSAMRQKLTDARNRQKELDEEYASYGENTTPEIEEAKSRLASIDTFGQIKLDGKLFNGKLFEGQNNAYKQLVREQKAADKNEIKELKSQLNNEPDNQQAQARLKELQDRQVTSIDTGLSYYDELYQQLYNEDREKVNAFDAEYNGGAKAYSGRQRVDDILQSFGNRTAGAGVNLAALGARAIDYGVGLGENVSAEELEANAYATDPTMLNRTEQEAYTQQWNDASRYNPETGEYGLGNETGAARAAGRLESIADQFDEKSQKALAEAKNGMSKLGQFGIDLASTALDVGFDAVTGGGLATMALRVLGQGTGEARRQGATVGQQFAYGASKAAIEVATEKIGDGLALVYGKGLSGDIVEKAIGKLAKTDAGANLLRVVAGAVGEGGEEVISDLLDPFTQWIISEEAREKGYWDQIDPSEVLYDFLLGAAMGLGGSVTDAATGGYQAKNVEQTDAMRRDLDNALPLSQRELDAYNKSEKQLADRLTKREENEVRAALKKAGVKGESLDSAVSELMRTGKSTARDRRDTIIRNARAEGVGLTDRETTLREEEEMLRNYDDEEAPPERTKGGDAWGFDPNAQEGPKSSRSEQEAPEGINTQEQGETKVGLDENRGITNAKEYAREQKRTEKETEKNKPKPKATVEEFDSLYKNGEVNALYEKYKRYKNPWRMAMREYVRNNDVTFEKGLTEQERDILYGEGQSKGARAENANVGAKDNETALETKDYGGLLSKDKKSGWSEEEKALVAKYPSLRRDFAYEAKNNAINGKFTVITKTGLFGGKIISSQYLYDGKHVYEINENSGGLREVTKNGRESLIWLSSDNTKSALESFRPAVYEMSQLDAVLGNKPSTSKAENGTIKESPKHKKTWDMPDIFNDEVSNEEALEYAKAANENRTILYEPQSADVIYVYDGKRLFTLDEDGLAESARAISPEEFAEMLSNGTKHNAYISLENEPVQYSENWSENNENEQGSDGDRRTPAAEANREATPSVATLRQRSEDVSRRKARDDAKRYQDEKIRERFLRRVDFYLDQNAKYISDSEYSPEMREMQKVAKRFGIKNVAFYYSDAISDTTGGSFSEATNTIHLVVFGKDPTRTKFTLKHELVHCLFKKFGIASIENLGEIIDSAFDGIPNAEKARRQYDYTLGLATRKYAWDYSFSLSAKYTYDDWAGLSKKQKETEIANLPNDEKRLLDRSIQEEMIAEAVAGSGAWFIFDPDLMVPWQANIKDYFAKKGYLNQNDFDAIDSIDVNLDDGDVADKNRENISVNDAEAEEAIEEEPETADEEEARPEPTGKRKGHKKGLEEKTQTGGARRHHDSWMTEVGKKYNTDNGTFVSYTRAEVSRIADYCIDKFGIEEEHERLMDKKDWNRVDFSEAGKIVYQMTVQLNRDMTNGARGLGPILERMVGETYEEYRARQAEADKEAYKERREPIDALLQAYAEQKSEAGQRLQEEHKFSTADDIRMRASQRFLNYSYDGEVVNATEGSKSAKMWRIMDDLLTRAEAAETAGNRGDLVELTRMVSRIRSRDNMFGKAGVKAEKFLFDRMLKGGLDAEKLAALAYGNISKIMDDLMPITYADAIESVRMNNMLSNFATGINNLVNNAAALRTQAIAQNAAIPFAKQFEKITGKKVAVRDTSWRRSKAIVRAEEVAYEYAVLSAYYGINAEDGRIDTKRGGGAGFSLTGTGASGMVGRALARYSFFVNSLVLSPDAPAKARARLGLQQGIEEAFKDADMNDPAVIKNMKELEAFANNEALRRTLQDDNKYTNFVKSVKTKLLGDIKTPGENIEIKGRKLGSFDLGSFMIAFAKVPTNVGIQKVAATPYGALYQVARYANGLIKAKANPESMTATEMAKLSRDVGRACTTVGMIGLGAIGAMTGALKNFDDTDDEEEKKLAAEKGYKGLTFNLGAIFHGGEWRDGDTVISGNFLEILATPLAIGAIMYDAMQEGASLPQAIHYGTVESFTQIVDAVTEIPGLQQVGQLYESFVNRDPNENDMKGMLKAVGQFAVNTGTSYFVPNLVSQTTAGVDNKQRDIYTTNSYAETLRNIVMSKTPGLRQMLPEKTDTFGNTRTYGDSPIMAVINTVLLPGDIRKYHVSDLEKELFRLNAAGYKSTWFDTKGPKNISAGDNEYGLTADERRAYHMTKARYLVEAYDEFRTSDEYKNLDDAQKAAVYKALRLDAERMTKNECLEAAGIEARATMDKWETEFDSWSGKINYLTAKQQALASWDTDENAVSDYAGMDAFIKNNYGKRDKKTKDLLNNSLSHLDDLYEASKVGIGSENWQKCYDIYREYNATDEEGHKVYKANMTNSSEMWARMQQETGLNDKQMRHIEDNMELRTMISPDTDQYYEYLDDAGLTRDEAKVTIRKMSELQPATGYTSVQNSQKYLVIVDTVPKAKQWDAFWTIVPSNASKKKVKTLREDQRKGVSLATALQHVGWNIVKTK